MYNTEHENGVLICSFHRTPISKSHGRFFCLKCQRDSATSRSVGANVDILTSWNRSMAVALEKVENGSNAEDMYFIEKLRKSAAVLGYSLTLCKEPKTT